MNGPNSQQFTLTIPALTLHLPVVTAAVETAAGIYGLDKDSALRLALATEEIFAYLANDICSGEPLEIQCINGVSFTRVEFRFSVSTLNMGALNMTASFVREEDASEMGLVIAARTIDRLSIIAEGQQRVCLAIEKDKAYPAAIASAALPVTGPALEDLAVRVPDAEDLKRFSVLAARWQDDPLQPAFLRYPGKVADMVASGGCQALFALSAKRDLAGGLFLLPRTERIVELIGPDCLYETNAPEIAERLLSAAISHIARTKALALLSRTGLPAAVQSQFELLGTLSYYRANGSTIDRPVFYRLLHEDPGCTVWTDATLKDYLSRQYERLYLAREILEVQDFGEARRGASIFSAEIDQELSEVVLRPQWPGDDAAENVVRHIQRLREEALLNIFFELDMGVSWHASLIPALTANGFQPELILPFAGQADIAVFQYHEP